MQASAILQQVNANYCSNGAILSPNGSNAKAPQAAGKIHTDFERGFIRAEIVPYETMLELGGYNQAKEHGKVRSEGKDYVMKDGDVVLFRFNV